MKFNFSVKGDFKDKLLATEKFVEDLTLALATDGAALLRKRVGMGLDDKDKKMRTKSPENLGAYSRPYGRFRQDKGRQITSVDLTFSGRMLGSLTARGPFGRGEKIFSTIEVLGGPDIRIRAISNQIRFSWFGLSPSNKKALSSVMKTFQERYRF